MSTRATEATALNTKLGELVTAISDYLAAGEGDSFEARGAVFTVIRNRLVSVLGPIEYLEQTGSATSVPDQLRADELAS